ncbi:hypothetical protein ACLUWM_09780 [Limosilactobacillus mucosae]
MTLNKDQQQLIDWYTSGYGRVAFRHGLSLELMQEWIKDQGYYQSEQGSELAGRMLREFRVEQIGYKISCLDPLSASVWLLLLTDKDKSQGNVAEQINTVAFDIAYNIRGLAKADGTGLYRVSMTIVDDTDLDQEQIMDYVDSRVANMTYNESKLLELLSSPQSQPRSYYYGLIDTYRALNIVL